MDFYFTSSMYPDNYHQPIPRSQQTNHATKPHTKTTNIILHVQTQTRNDHTSIISGFPYTNKTLKQNTL